MWKRPIFFILWSKRSFLLFTSSYYLKDLPNKSIMLNEHGEKWQSRNWAFRITLQMHLMNTLVKEPLSLIIPTAQSGVPLFLEQRHWELAESSHCSPAGSDRSESSSWIPLIFLPLPLWVAIFIHEKKNPFFSFSSIPSIIHLHFWVR